MNEIPQPEAIVDLVEEAIRHPWPKNQAEKNALFKRLGWGQGKKSPASTNDARDIADHFHLEPRDGGPPIFATSRELDGLIESIHLQIRLDSALPDPQATQCFDAILRQLTNLHGEPTIPWHGQRGLRKMWHVNDIDIDITYNDSRSSLTIGIQDERSFAEVEAYARANSAE
ncbi:hypothetical protein CVS28_19100 [Arthrobacter glacialis]|nr:hypothetical protein CVS28_19100 [Arthrobacter glacialis]